MFTTVAAVAVSTGLLLTGCSAPNTNTSSSVVNGTINELDSIADASTTLAAEKGFVETVKINATTYVLVYIPKGPDGKPQTAMKSITQAEVDATTGEFPADADASGMVTQYILDRGYDNFDPIVVKKYLSGGLMFTNEGGSAVKNSETSFTIKTPRQPDTIVTVKDGVIVGIKQTFQPTGGNTTATPQVLTSTVVYDASSAEAKDIVAKATESAKKIAEANAANNAASNG